MATAWKWQFKARLRARAYNWRGTALATARLKEAVSEIKAAAKIDPVSAGDGAVALMERLWPALQDIDSSSGALGSAVNRTLNDLIPILIDAPADQKTRGKWLERLYQAVQDDGVQYLSPVEERWGEIAQFPELINAYADELLDFVRRAWANHTSFQYVIGTDICLSCLLEAGRHTELLALLETPRTKHWSAVQFGASALLRQGMWEEAIAYAEASRSKLNPGFVDHSIDRFCEKLLIEKGRTDEAYKRYGLGAAVGGTNLTIYRSLTRAYPERDKRQVLLDLIETRGDKGKWFAAAKDAGFLDIAIECASTHGADPSTLNRGARDFCAKDPKFASTVALLALKSLLAGGGYDPQVSEARDAATHLLEAAQHIGADDWARTELEKLANGPCSADRMLFRNAVKLVMARADAGQT